MANAIVTGMIGKHGVSTVIINGVSMDARMEGENFKLVYPEDLVEYKRGTNSIAFWQNPKGLTAIMTLVLFKGSPNDLTLDDIVNQQANDFVGSTFINCSVMVPVTVHENNNQQRTKLFTLIGGAVKKLPDFAEGSNINDARVGTSYDIIFLRGTGNWV